MTLKLMLHSVAALNSQRAWHIDENYVTQQSERSAGAQAGVRGILPLARHWHRVSRLSACSLQMRAAHPPARRKTL